MTIHITQEKGKRRSHHSTTAKVLKTIFLILAWTMIGLYTEISGTTQKDLIIRTKSNYELVSRAISGRSAGYFIGSLIGGPLVDKLERYCDLMIAICLDGAAIATVISPYSPGVNVLFVMLILGGTFEGIINIAGQKLILNIWKEKSTGPMHILHFGFGMGSFIVPQIATPFLAVPAGFNVLNSNTTMDHTTTSMNFSVITYNITRVIENTQAFIKESRIEWAYLIVAIIVALLSVVFFIYQFNGRYMFYEPVSRNPKHHEGQLKKVVKIFDPATCAGGNRWFGIQIFTLIFLYFFNAVGGERLFSKFIRSYSIDKHGFSGTAGSLINTVFWISFSVGRFTGLFAGRFIPVRILIMIEACGALVTAILLDIFARDNALALWILTCPMGFFLSQLFPTGIGWGNFHVQFTGFAITFALMGGALGGVIYLWVIGYLYEYHGYDMFIHQLVVYGALLVLFAILLTIIGVRHGGRFVKHDVDSEIDQNLNDKFIDHEENDKSDPAEKTDYDSL